VGPSELYLPMMSRIVAVFMPMSVLRIMSSQSRRSCWAS
jgi:hypothetical protein